MLIALILPYKLEATSVIVKAYERLYIEDEVGDIEGVLNLGTIVLFDVNTVHKLFDILLNTEVHNCQMVESNKCQLIILCGWL